MSFLKLEKMIEYYSYATHTSKAVIYASMLIKILLEVFGNMEIFHYQHPPGNSIQHIWG